MKIITRLRESGTRSKKDYFNDRNKENGAENGSEKFAFNAFFILRLLFTIARAVYHLENITEIYSEAQLAIKHGKTI